MFTCQWCNTHYTNWRSKCHACGGSMPPLPGHELGPMPPAEPRPLPSGYALRTRFLNISVMLGLGFSALPGLFLIQLLSHGHWAIALLPGAMVLIGLLLLIHGWTKVSGILRALRQGKAVAGKVASLNLDMSQSMNKKHPWRLAYHFTVDGQLYEGVVTSLDTTFARRSAGQPIWVVYMESDPTQNTLYPAVRHF